MSDTRRLRDCLRPCAARSSRPTCDRQPRLECALRTWPRLSSADFYKGIFDFVRWPLRHLRPCAVESTPRSEPAFLSDKRIRELRTLFDRASPRVLLLFKRPAKIWQRGLGPGLVFAAMPPTVFKYNGGYSDSVDSGDESEDWVTTDADYDASGEDG